MLYFPSEKPVIQQLNSYYIDIAKLLEHYQGELDCGIVHFKSPLVEAAVFFDEHHLLGGVCQGKGTPVTGQAAIDRIIHLAADTNFAIAVYRADPGAIYYWASLPAAAMLHSDLESEFTDLEGLIRNLQAQKLFGYIDIAFPGLREEGAIFLQNGAIVASVWNGPDGKPVKGGKALERLIAKTRQEKATFNVRRLRQDRELPEAEAPLPAPAAAPPGALEMLQKLLRIFENAVAQSRRSEDRFETLLKRKFVAKADRYPFLDPFAAELNYAGGKLTFTGNETDQALLKGVIESVLELAEELELTQELRERIKPWQRKYGQVIEQAGIRI